MTHTDSDCPHKEKAESYDYLYKHGPLVKKQIDLLEQENKKLEKTHEQMSLKKHEYHQKYLKLRAGIEKVRNRITHELQFQLDSNKEALQTPEHYEPEEVQEFKNNIIRIEAEIKIYSAILEMK